MKVDNINIDKPIVTVTFLQYHYGHIL